ncbi:MAG: tRNA dihydrouridine synthase DusB [bacterium]
MSDLASGFSYRPGISFRNRLVLAPMAGITDASFRRICWEQGVGLLYSEMISSHALLLGNKPTVRMLDNCLSEFPVNVQIFGSDPSVMAEAALICQDRGVRMLDINMGCPVTKVFNRGAGAALMSDPLRAYKMVAQVRKAVKVPVSVKIRSGVSHQRINAVEAARAVREAGADMIAVHPRTRAQMFKEKADWSVIAEVKKAVDIPVVGNGDVASGEDARRMLRETGCDLVMIGRAAGCRPWLFKEILTGAGIDHQEEYRLILRHFGCMLDEHGEKKGVKGFRKHLLWYTKGFPGAVTARRRLAEIKSRNEIMETLDLIFSSKALLANKAGLPEILGC